MTITLIILAIFVMFILFKYFIAKNKPSDRRSAIENIIVSIFTIFRKNTEDTARAIRTPKVLKEEAMQEVEDALKNLESTFITNQKNLRLAKKKLEEEILPKLKLQPGTLSAKAKKAKTDYEKSVQEGNPIEAYKTNACKFLSYKAKAFENIAKTEKNIKKLDTVIKTSKADYDGQKIDLEMIKTDLMSMTEIERYSLNQSIARITSLQNELSSRMNEQAIEREVEEELNSNPIDINLETEFNNL